LNSARYTRPALWRDFSAPAAALAQTPAAGIARVLMFALCGLCLGLLLWAWLSRIEILANAPGKVVVVGQNKSIQSLVPGVVSELWVEEGERVLAGQPLLTLDATIADAELRQLQDTGQRLVQDEWRLRALLHAARNELGSPVQTAPQGALNEDTQTRLAAEWLAFKAALAALANEQQQQRSRLAATARETRAEQQSLALLVEETRALASLQARGVVPRVQYLQRERDRLALVQSLAALDGQRGEAQAALAGLNARRQATRAEFTRRWQGELAALEERLLALQAAVIKARTQRDRLTLYAPVAGRVQALALHASGAVVNPAEALMQIVPEDGPLTIEALVENRDRGFIQRGQPVRIKVDAFNFTRYGTLQGVVREIAADAQTGPDRALRFVVTIRPDDETLSVDGRPQRVTPGMSVTVDFELGTRRVLDFLLSPLRRYRAESGREP
jgi:hemolysin D